MEITRAHLQNEINRHFGQLLQSERRRSKKSFEEISSALGMNELKLKQIEKKPATVPCCELYRIIAHYGPEALFQAEIVFQKVEALGRKFRRQAEQRDPADNVFPLRKQNEELENAAAELGLEIARQQLEARKAKAPVRSARSKYRVWCLHRWIRFVIAFSLGRLIYDLACFIVRKATSTS